MKQPCIRGLGVFKKGCPKKEWDGEEGCPAWREMIVSSRDAPLKKENRGQCIDLWDHEFMLVQNGLLEGCQQATESFRNGVVDESGTLKPDPAVVQLLRVFNEIKINQQAISNHEGKKINS